MIMSILLIFLLFLGLTESETPGIKVGLNKQALQYAVTKVVDVLEKEVTKITVPDVLRHRYKIQNTRIQWFEKPSASVDLHEGAGVTMKLRGGGVGLEGKWQVKPFFGWKKGDFEIEFKDIHLDVSVMIFAQNERPTLKTKSCKVKFRKFGLKTSKVPVNWFLKIMNKIFKKIINRIIEKQICKKLLEVINVKANKKLRTLNLLAEVNKRIQLDNHLTSPPIILHDSIILQYRGHFHHDPQSFFNPSDLPMKADKMVTMSISEDTLNSLSRVLHQESLIDYRLNASKLKFLKFVTSALNSENFIHLHSESAPKIAVTSSAVAVNLSLNVDFHLQPNSKSYSNINLKSGSIPSPQYNSEAFLKLKLHLGANIDIFVEKSRIKARVSKLEPSVEVLSSKLSSFLNTFTIKQLTINSADQLLAKLNKQLLHGIPLPSLTHVTLNDSHVTFEKGQVKIATDFI